MINFSIDISIAEQSVVEKIGLRTFQLGIQMKYQILKKGAFEIITLKFFLKKAKKAFPKYCMFDFVLFQSKTRIINNL